MITPSAAQRGHGQAGGGGVAAPGGGGGEANAVLSGGGGEGGEHLASVAAPVRVGSSLRLSVEMEPHDLSAAAGTSSGAEGQATEGSAAGGSSLRLSTGGRIPAPRFAAEPPEAVDYGGGDVHGLEGLELSKELADVFEREVLPRLDATDRAMLGQVGSAWRALVASCTELPRAGLKAGAYTRSLFSSM